MIHTLIIQWYPADSVQLAFPGTKYPGEHRDKEEYEYYQREHAHKVHSADLFEVMNEFHVIILWLAISQCRFGLRVDIGSQPLQVSDQCYDLGIGRCFDLVLL